MAQQELIPHLFRTEFSRITAVLCKYLGIEHTEVAEDIASETFLSALETWTYKGIPEKPVAWLYTVARNKAKNYLHRNQIFTDKIIPHQRGDLTSSQHAEVDLSDKNIFDSQLQMLFAICHPGIPPEAQIGLALRILCGFGIDEIATAFLTNKETINKRLFRAREKLRAEKVIIEFPSDEELGSRLDSVLRTLYLLFSEGYYSESNDSVVRKELCIEAMRLTRLLIDCEQTDRPAVNALLALMCFHASRFNARQNEYGDMILYDDQDESVWDQQLISSGVNYLHRASKGESVSKYHLEAAIAYWHTRKENTNEKWENILSLYDKLILQEASPVAALNRAFAVAKARGTHKGITETEKLQLLDNHYYYTLLGELYKTLDADKSLANFKLALSLAKTETDKQTIRRKIDAM